MASKLKINDFGLFCTTISDITKVSEMARIDFTKHGFTCSVTLAKRERVGRVDFSSNSVQLEDDDERDTITIATKTLGMFSQLLKKIEKAHAVKSSKVTPDYSDVIIAISDTSIGIKSSTIKTKLNLCEACVVNTPEPFKHKCTPVAEINVQVSDLKDTLSNTFMFHNQESLCVEICHQNDMVKNNAYSVLSDPTDPRTNAIATKFGNITSGDLTRKFFVDIPRIQLLAMFDVPKFTVVLNQEPCAITEFSVRGDNSFSTQYRVIFKYLAAPIVPQQVSA